MLQSDTLRLTCEGRLLQSAALRGPQLRLSLPRVLLLLVFLVHTVQLGQKVGQTDLALLQFGRQVLVLLLQRSELLQQR